VKTVTTEQLAHILADLPDNPRIVASGNFAMPRTVLGIIDEVVPRYRLNMLNAQPGVPDRDGVVHETIFVGPGVRHSERLEYTPCRLSLGPILFRREQRPDVVVIHTSHLRYDTVSLGIEVNVLPAAIEAAREHGAIVIAQANEAMPYTYGDAQIYDHEIDYLVEVDEPLATHQPGEAGDVARSIGDRIAQLVADGSTLQLGIGAVPDAVLAQLTRHRGLRIWTEMFSDGVLALDAQGCLDPDIPLTASFLFGSKDLYDFVHLNRRVRMLRTENTNDPGRIMRQRQMTSVNSALQVDLFDQANASRIRGTIYSGFGGSVDFIEGALHSRGGAAYIALPSWHAKANVSTIVPRISEPVTSFQHSAVVTEHGVAPAFGHSQPEQARAIIESAAHPDAREELRASAREMCLLED
jgi:acyl-CoA hydrolase